MQSKFFIAFFVNKPTILGISIAKKVQKQIKANKLFEIHIICIYGKNLSLLKISNKRNTITSQQFDIIKILNINAKQNPKK